MINAQTALRQSRLAYDAAVASRKLQDLTLNGEKRKYELGTSTLFNVVIAQRDATARAIAEADAKNQYARSQNALMQVLGTTLEAYGVDIDDAKSGTVKREPDMIPTIGQNR